MARNRQACYAHNEIGLFLQRVEEWPKNLGIFKSSEWIELFLDAALV